MELKYTTQDLKRYLDLIDNFGNDNFKIPTKDLPDYRISYAILFEEILSEEHSVKALKALETAESNVSIDLYDNKRKEANIYISKIKIRKEVFSIHGKNCLRCGSAIKIALDHIIPVSIGGKNSIDNLQPLCNICNSSKGNKVIDYRKRVTCAKKQ